MKRFSLLISAISISLLSLNGQERIKTEWGEKLDVNNVLNEYPRPIMERPDWANLNGYWDYSIINMNEAAKYSDFDGKILVPFAIESSLSGVQKKITAEEKISYHRTFTLPSNWKNKRVLLHFGAVDWKTEVWVNGIRVGEHKGGYTPFSFDITSALKAKGENEIAVTVWDPTESFQPNGKQILNPESIWYTSVSGIWQTVWLEPVGQTYIENLKITPNIDTKELLIDASVVDICKNDIVNVSIFDKGVKVASAKSISGTAAKVNMPSDMKLWSPDSPFLYDLEVSVVRNGKVIDQVKSYAAMRKISTLKDKDGQTKLQLNNEFIFQFGPLDQGWWPDGLYTAPTDEALKWDIEFTKALGFNMIRKHIKVEPARWYTYCDQLGIIVWQDMPSSDRGKSPEHWEVRDYYKGEEPVRTKESEDTHRKEWKEIIDALYNYPSICVWVPFNECWGQFKTREVVDWTKAYDPSRLVNQASGGNFYKDCGDILDSHNYPAPAILIEGKDQAVVVGEYGGIGYVIPDHIWEPNQNWGYIQYNSSKEVTDTYVEYAEILLRLVKENGLTGAVYTQTTDVEIEVNGLATYDRKVVKVDVKRIKEINDKLCKSLK